ncbi:MAG: hypothetical protein H6598_07880 [Flavobacteriales bacterium]|nr:hypothetical protein [Flavobacteriales bacterium]MCB9196131.1 hypothetical protein [Flavobacteriales bacterium]
MKTLFRSIYSTAIILGIAATITTSCKKENEEDELSMTLKTDSGYTFESGNVSTGTDVKFGIEAQTTKKKDPIIKFTISESINGKADEVVYSEDLEVTQYDHDYNFTFSDTAGSIHEYTFALTNRDGIVLLKMVTLTGQ